MKKTFLVLYTSIPSTISIEDNQRAVISILKSRDFQILELDGANIENATLRSKLWALPGSKRAIYPQVYEKKSEEDYEYVGDFDKIIQLNDSGDLFNK